MAYRIVLAYLHPNFSSDWVIEENMKSAIRSLALAAALTLAGGAAMAADQAMKDCCCKDKDGKMTCCDDMKKPEASPSVSQQQPAPEHKH